MAAQGYIAQDQVQYNGQRHDHRAGEEDALQPVKQAGTDVGEKRLQEMQSAG